MRSVNLDYQDFRWAGLGTFYFDDAAGFMYQKKKYGEAVYFVPLDHCNVKCRKEALSGSCTAAIRRLHEKGWANPSAYTSIVIAYHNATGTYMEIYKLVTKEIQRLNEEKRQREAHRKSVGELLSKIESGKYADGKI